MSADEHVIDYLPAFALDCLDEDEARMVKEHLRNCALCQVELRSYQAVAERLPLAVPAVDPPARVKQALMERIGSRILAEPVSEQPSWQDRIMNLIRRLSPAWSLLSLFLILILAASNLVLWRQVRQLSASQMQALQTVNLTGTEAAPGATGLLVISIDGSHGTLGVDSSG
jgi:anti-sigma factor RsiW